MKNLYFCKIFLYSLPMKGAMSSQGQVTIPKRVRDALRLEAGDVIDFEVRGNELVGRPRRTERPWESLVGAIANGRRTDEVMRELRPDRAW